jgi:hypothetical protein
VGGSTLNDYATVACNPSQSGIDAVDPNVWQQARATRGVSTRNPGATDTSGRVIEARMSSVAEPDVPAEYPFVENGRLAYIDGSDL